MQKSFFCFLFLCANLFCATNQNPFPKYDTRGSYTLALDKGILFIEGEYLYWKPYAFIPYFIQSEMSLFDLPTNKKEPQLSLKAHSGYRIKLGCYLSRSWYTSAQYTQLFSEGNDFISTDGGAITQAGVGGHRAATIWPYREPTFGGVNPIQANAHERLRLKLVDVILSRSFKTKYSFTLDPYFGVRYARIKIDMNILYSQPQLVGPVTGSIGTVTVDLNNHFNSYGLRAGLKSNWKLGYGFECFGNMSISSLLGTFILRNQQVYFRLAQTNPPITDVLSTSAQKLKDIYLSYQFVLGLIWGKKIEDWYYFGIKLGYETNIWPNFLRIKSYPAPFSTFQSAPAIYPFKNNLSTQGLNASIRMDF